MAKTLTELGKEVHELTTTIGDLKTDVAVLAKEVATHISLFKWAIGGSITLFVAIGSTLWIMNGKLSEVTTAQANVTPRTVAQLLSHPASSSKVEIAESLTASAVVLDTTQIISKKPDPTLIRSVSRSLTRDQQTYPELPEVWRATSSFINYKFQALTPNAAKVTKEASGRVCEKRLTDAGFIYENCDTDLQKALEMTRNNSVNGIVTPITFLRCHIVYSGEPLPTATFILLDCIVSVKVSSVPPQAAMALLQKLTTAEPSGRLEFTS